MFIFTSDLDEDQITFYDKFIQKTMTFQKIHTFKHHYTIATGEKEDEEKKEKYTYTHTYAIDVQVLKTPIV